MHRYQTMSHYVEMCMMECFLYFQYDCFRMILTCVTERLHEIMALMIYLEDGHGSVKAGELQQAVSLIR